MLVLCSVTSSRPIERNSTALPEEVFRGDFGIIYWWTNVDMS